MPRLLKPVLTGSARSSQTVRASGRTAAMSVALLTLAMWVILAGYCLYVMLLLDVALPGRSGETLAGLAAMAGVLVIGHAYVLQTRRQALAALAAACDAAGERLNHIEQDALREALLRGGAAAFVDAAAIPLVIGGLALIGGWIAAIPLVGAVLGLVILSIEANAVRRFGRLDVARRTRDGAALIVSTNRQYLGQLGLYERAMAVASSHRRTVALSDAEAAAAEGRALGAISLLAGFSLAGSAAAATSIVASDAASIGALAVTLLMTCLVFQPLRRLAAHLPTLMFAAPEWKVLLAAEAQPNAATAMVALPRPARELDVSGLTVPVAGTRRLTLQDVTFNATAGDVVAVIGPAAGGKSTLLEALIGQIPNASGYVRLDGAALNQWDRAALRQHVGYLPQLPGLLRGTVAQNISGFGSELGEAIIRAAQVAGVHDDIVRLPDGYDTMIAEPGALPLALSLQQRIAWARALFGEPFLVLLDNPASFQDNDGHLALRRCLARLRARGAVTIVTGDAASIIDSASHVLVLRHGGVLEFGTTEEVRGKMVERQRREAERLASVSVFAEPRETLADAPLVE
ncbi:ATP-binding cassette domain-containing protein [Sphingomonas sp. CCH5-D11]|uniref:ATP-binding cassette domain-containing protein n=1 Tax=Sphingomonas sp. CCH5-D11 TaxID=1768786 RepID=UPI000832685C|nr:ATP-binding cassette domain-containing protein [Sphingomonas sp. CCH5-D11]